VSAFEGLGFVDPILETALHGPEHWQCGSGAMLEMVAIVAGWVALIWFALDMPFSLLVQVMSRVTPTVHLAPPMNCFCYVMSYFVVSCALLWLLGLCWINFAVHGRNGVACVPIARPPACACAHHILSLSLSLSLSRRPFLSHPFPSSPLVSYALRATHLVSRHSTTSILVSMQRRI